MTQPLFPARPDPRMLCIGCDAPREVDPEKCAPGVIFYKRCSCGEIGIYREGDKHQRLLRRLIEQKLLRATRDRAIKVHRDDPYRGGKA